MRILVGSKNPVKINASKEAFEKYFNNVEVIGINVESGVPAQPVEDQVLQGAKIRAGNLFGLNMKRNLNAEYFVGIEGGIAKLSNRWFSFGGICILNAQKQAGYGTSPLFELPAPIIKQLLEGKELGDVMDELQNKENTKQKHGAIGFLTGGVMNRKELYVSGIITAMVPLIKPDLFFNGN